MFLLKIILYVLLPFIGLPLFFFFFPISSYILYTLDISFYYLGL